MSDGPAELEPIEARKFPISEKDQAVLALTIERQRRLLAEAQLAKIESDNLLAQSNQQSRIAHDMLCKLSGLTSADLQGRKYTADGGFLTFGAVSKITPVSE